MNGKSTDVEEKGMYALYAGTSELIENLINANDKYDAAIAVQPEANMTNRCYSLGDYSTICEMKESDLYKLDADHDDVTSDIKKVLAPTNSRFTIVAYYIMELYIAGVELARRLFHRILALGEI